MEKKNSNLKSNYCVFITFTNPENIGDFQCKNHHGGSLNSCMAETKNKNIGNGIGIGAAIGVAIGAAYGYSSREISQSIAWGLALGVAFGAIFDFINRPST